MAATTFDDLELDPQAEDSSSDEDFNPDVPNQPEESASSESEAEALTAAKTRGKKRKAPDADGHEELEWDSGDEKIVKERKRRRKKGKRKDDEVDISEEEEGEAGFIKTRSQRKTEAIERKALATTKGSTVDVDALWSSITSAPIRATSVLKPPATHDPSSLPNPSAPQPAAIADSESITITRTYQFAGKTHHDSRRVPKDSAEAKLYLSSLEASKAKPTTDADQPTVDGDGATGPDGLPSDEIKPPPLRRPSKRPSRFDPNPTGIVRTLPAELQLTWPRTRAPSGPAPSAVTHAKSKALAATKLNTVDKSRYDWVGFVDREGIAGELELHGRAKGNYLGRKVFLDRVEARRDDAGKAG
ncbi:hypothetical protein P152DRAFT_459381 [Eremomyces bilateralis CBS 781.70]|uniref:SWR1-complex protein 5 n=1 Tax=Eremomyces bilateralis CBS 781.70 TaxID=1392243 RepID=A0A6G1G078_9PEZI|nr:uncharacterized protein P152DRAFT_459381 [Eremomyces bilateralis CBS 781.70]KAF1811443.1 hypothetical protein P152DRAFT_459381 [Eremomyces bilateralis CBS 781.70]